MKLKYGTRFKYLEDAKREKYLQENCYDTNHVYRIKQVEDGAYKGWYYLYILNLTT